MGFKPRKIKLKQHECKIPRHYKHRKTMDMPVDYTKDKMHMHDTREFKGTRASKEDINRFIKEHGITKLSRGGRVTL